MALANLFVRKDKQAVQGKVLSQEDLRPTMEDLKASLVLAEQKPSKSKIGVKTSVTIVQNKRICKDLYERTITTKVEYIVPNLEEVEQRIPKDTRLYNLLVLVIKSRAKYNPQWKFLWSKNTKPAQFCFLRLADNRKFVYTWEEVRQNIPIFSNFVPELEK